SSYTENSITLAVVVVIKARKWCERAKENVLVKYGAFSSSLKRRPYKPAATVGFGVNVDGFGESVMTSRSKVAENNHPLQIANWKIPEFKSRRPITELISLTTRNSSQNAVGSALTKKTSAKS
uniref:Uncharacterized protein n=1 Tax=Ciona savignyi TaxID=51511 RepID=H2Z925_CIOSA